MKQLAADLGDNFMCSHHYKQFIRKYLYNPVIIEVCTLHLAHCIIRHIVIDDHALLHLFRNKHNEPDTLYCVIQTPHNVHYQIKSVGGDIRLPVT